MNKRSYNIFFHLHTISGIIISAALFVIFFTGSFSFFRDEIANWQKNEEVTPKIIHSDVGLISETDVSLAKASNAVLIAFNVKPSKEAKKLAENEKINISSYNIMILLRNYILPIYFELEEIYWSVGRSLIHYFPDTLIVKYVWVVSFPISFQVNISSRVS